MKYFYSITETTGYPTRTEYLQNKRKIVLETIKPICDAFGIKDYDYVICNGLSEHLVIEGTRIGCCSNSIGATVQELIIYLFVNYASDRLHAFKTQSLNELKRYWIYDNL